MEDGTDGICREVSVDAVLAVGFGEEQATGIKQGLLQSLKRLLLGSFPLPLGFLGEEGYQRGS